MTIEHKLEEEFEVHEYLEAREGTETNRQRNSSHAHIGSTKLNSEEDKHDSESISVRNGEFSEAKAKRRRRKKGQKTQNKQAQEFKARVVSLVINRQLNSMLDSLSLQSNSCY